MEILLYAIMTVPKSRVTFSCPIDLRKKITELAINEGISRGKKIVELLEAGLQAEKAGIVISSESNFEKRITKIEQWQAEQEVNIQNLESITAAILNDNISPEVLNSFKRKKGSTNIPTPSKG